MKPCFQTPLVLLGAGASKPAGIPTAVEMTERMIKFCHEDGEADYGRALNALAHMLKISGGNTVSTSCADIESVMNAAQFLANRSELEFAPFVGAWHPIIEDLERQTLTTTEARKIASKAALAGASFTSADYMPTQRGGEPPLTRQSIEAALQSVMNDLGSLISQAPDGTLFRGLTSYLTGKLVEITFKKTDEQLEYLSPLLERGQKGKITIATLNYDNCIERRASSLKIPCATGLHHPKMGEVGGWSCDGIFPEISKGIDLVKLHGSTTWFWSGPKKDTSGLTERPIMEISDNEIMNIIGNSQQVRNHYGKGNDTAIGGQLAVIFGGHNKLTAEGPFLDLLSKFKAGLEKHSELIVIGYSFRDPHINHCISQWLMRKNQSKIVVIGGKKSNKNDCILFQKLQGTAALARCTYKGVGAEQGIKEYFSGT